MRCGSILGEKRPVFKKGVGKFSIGGEVNKAGSEMITLTKKQTRQPSTKRVRIEHLARTELDRHCHFRGRVDGFEFRSRDRVLTVRGRVPSFYLRRLLEKVLLRVDGVQSIDNQVDVVCCDGLSSVRSSMNP